MPGGLAIRWDRQLTATSLEISEIHYICHFDYRKVALGADNRVLLVGGVQVNQRKKEAFLFPAHGFPRMLLNFQAMAIGDSAARKQYLYLDCFSCSHDICKYDESIDTKRV